MSFARLLEILEIPELIELLQFLQFLQLLQILHGLSVAPDSLQIVEQTVLLGEHVDDDIAVVHQDPVGTTGSFYLFWFISCSSEMLFYIIYDCLYLIQVASACD